MKTPFIVIIFLSLCLFFAFDSFGKMYKWIDEEGRTHFSDKPPQSKKAEIINEYETIEEKNKFQKGSRYSTSSDPLIIDSWKWKSMDSIDRTRIEGVVKNTSSVTIKNAKIVISAKDGKGRLLGIGTSVLNPPIIKPDGKAIFMLYIRSKCSTRHLNISCSFEY